MWEVTGVAYEQFIVPSPHCGLPEYGEEFTIYYFQYNRGTDLTAVLESLQSVPCTDSSANIRSTTSSDRFSSIRFEMNRAAYLQVHVYINFIITAI